MCRSVSWLVLVGALFLPSLASAQGKGRGSEQEAARNGWTFSFTTGKEEAKKSGKPMMVVVRCVP